MQALSECKTLGGLLLLAGTLALSTPGVRVHAADADAPMPRAETPKAESSSSCSAGEAKAAQPKVRSESLARLQQAMRAELTADGEPWVVLNGRGYNYAPERNPLRDVMRLQLEAERQRGDR